MATNTPNFNLVKPDLNDNVDIAVLNGNMDIIDGALVSVGDLDDLNDVSITSPTAGQKLVFDGTNWVNLTGYQFVQTIYYTSSGTFTKADYPWLRAIRVRCVGGGSGGGGAAAAVPGTSHSIGSGGGSGGYSESFITDITGLDASVTVTRGGGGAGGTGAAGAGGNDSSFGSLVVALGAELGGEVFGPSIEPSVLSSRGRGPAGTGQVAVAGEDGLPGLIVRPGSTGAAPQTGGNGGSSVLGAGGRAARNGNGSDGAGFGAGGGGASNNSTSARTGGAGSNGIVIVDLFA